MPVSNPDVNPEPPPTRATRRTLLQTASAGVAASAASLVFTAPARRAQGLTPTSRGATTPQEAIMSQATPVADAPVTVVLVHGAFADASGWAGVLTRLQAAGIPAVAPPNPLRGVSHDSAYIASVVQQIPGPVLLVAHSYGGVVISNASPMADNVV
ncbi:MAG: alpha/beta hydrolase, partial [Thermomicrobiales bacterium]